MKLIYEIYKEDKLIEQKITDNYSINDWKEKVQEVTQLCSWMGIKTNVIDQNQHIEVFEPDGSGKKVFKLIIN